MSSCPNHSVHVQYRDSKNLAARISLHQRFSTNPYGWMRWVFDQMTFPPNGRVLELGCGTGEVWRENAARIPPDAALVFSDVSIGMLRETKRSLQRLAATVQFSAGDATSIPFPDGSFDVVVANHILYHVDAPADAIREIRRVLRQGGFVYATTNGLGHLKEISQLLHEFDAGIACPLSGPAQRFGLENGANQFREFFDDVTVRKHRDSLRITEAGPFVDYVMSLHGVGNVIERLTGGTQRRFEAFISDKLACLGSITVTKNSGMLVASVKNEPAGQAQGE